MELFTFLEPTWSPVAWPTCRFPGRGALADTPPELAAWPDVEREVETVPSRPAPPVQPSPWTVGSRRGRVKTLGAFHCARPANAIITRGDAHLESAEPRSRVRVTAPHGLAEVTGQWIDIRVCDRVPQLNLAIRCVSRGAGLPFRSASAIAGDIACFFLAWFFPRLALSSGCLYKTSAKRAVLVQWCFWRAASSVLRKSRCAGACLCEFLVV